MVLHSKFLYCKNKQCHQFISSQTSTLLGKVCRTFWWEKIFWKYDLFIRVKALPSFSSSFMSHPGTLQWGMWLEKVLWGHKRQILRGVAHSHYTLLTGDQVMRSDPKQSPRGPFVGKCLQGGWVAFHGRIPPLAPQWSICALCSLELSFCE